MHQSILKANRVQPGHSSTNDPSSFASSSTPSSAAGRRDEDRDCPEPMTSRGWRRARSLSGRDPSARSEVELLTRKLAPKNTSATEISCVEGALTNLHACLSLCLRNAHWAPKDVGCIQYVNSGKRRPAPASSCAHAPSPESMASIHSQTSGGSHLLLLRGYLKMIKILTIETKSKNAANSIMLHSLKRC